MIYGGFDINDTLAIELSYLRGADIETEFTVNNSTTVFDTSLSGFNPGIFLKHNADQQTWFGHIGMMFWDAEFDVGNNTILTSDGSDMTFGFGVESKISDKSSIRGEWRYLDADGLHTSLFFLSVYRYF